MDGRQQPAARRRPHLPRPWALGLEAERPQPPVGGNDGACSIRGGIAGIAVVAVDRYTRQVSIGEDLIALAEHVDIKIGGGRAGILDLTTYEGITQLRGMVQQAANESLSTSFRLRRSWSHRPAKASPSAAVRSFGFEVVGNKYVIEVPQRADEADVRPRGGAPSPGWGGRWSRGPSPPTSTSVVSGPPEVESGPGGEPRSDAGAETLRRRGRASRGRWCRDDGR